MTRLIRYVAYLSGLASVTTRLVTAQISPGELSSAHAPLEGIANCTQCHSLGKTIASDRCLACHLEIRLRLATGRGLHGRNGYRQCIDCHKEHHGRDFSITRLDAKSFDHSLTGYDLRGKHAQVECRKCHMGEKVRSEGLLKKSDEFRERTYLGLSDECAACHRDEHVGQLPTLCEECHTLEGWEPASKFSHDRASYKLTGKHETVACAACHKKTYGTTVQYVRFEFGDCSACHADPHRGTFSQPCQSCHTTAGWNEGRAQSFDHASTKFPLRGKHAAVRCEQCHKGLGKKGKNIPGAFEIVRFDQCSDCHSDAHAGQFAKRRDGGKCESCHNQDAFVPSRYSVENHTNSRFKLSGAHAATACTACHKAGLVQAKSSRRFVWAEELRCATCHSDIHNGEFNTPPKKACEACHTPASWNSLLFKHETTRFALWGKHAEIPCAKCHTRTEAGTQTPNVRYRSLPGRCSDCHRDEHEGQFASAGTSDCARCHAVTVWKIDNFDHTVQTRYSLTGKHREVPCAKCHKAEAGKGKTLVRYKPLGTACVDCHPATDSHDKK